MTGLLHDHGDDSELALVRAKAASCSTWVSVIINVVLSVTQILVGTFAKSLGLITDGIHSLSDLVADKEHPYRHQRFETAASLVVDAHI
jgi:divalent metal cation (Fe/Co/Zn/Cd) transporter